MIEFIIDIAKIAASIFLILFICGAIDAALDFLNKTELSKLTGKTRQTIYNWYKNEYDLFLTLLVGAVVKKNFKDDNCIAIGKKLEVFKILFEIKGNNEKS